MHDRREETRNVTRTERLLKVLQLQNISYYQERIIQIITRKIEYMGTSKNEVERATHLELQYIAKMRPETYRNPNVIAYFSQVIEAPNVPKALFTTLFMIYGHVFQHDVAPPVIMAKLLFLDVVGPQEFCKWERALEWIHRVQLTFFFEPSILSNASKLTLMRYGTMDATEVPQRFMGYNVAIDGPEAGMLQGRVSMMAETLQTIMDRGAVECVIFFLQLPPVRRIFLERYMVIAETYPAMIPQLFKSVGFFLKHADPDDPRSGEFLAQVLALKVDPFREEMKRTLNEVAAMSNVYSSIVFNTRMPTVTSNEREKVDHSVNSSVQTLLTSSIDGATIERIGQNFRDLQPSFAWSYELLSGLIGASVHSPDGAIRVWIMCITVLKCTQFDSDSYAKMADLASAYVTFIRMHSDDGVFRQVAAESADVVIPRAFADTGLPIRADGFTMLLANESGLGLAFHMACGAAKYQKTRTGNPLVGDTMALVMNIVHMCASDRFGTRAAALALASVLVVVSPIGIGRQIYNEEPIRKVVSEFLTHLVQGGNEPEVPDVLEASVTVVNANQMYEFVNKCALMSCLCPNDVLACTQPSYLDDMLIWADVCDPPPVWVSCIDQARIATVGNTALTKYVLVEVTAKASKSVGIPVSRMFDPEEMQRWTRLITSRCIPPQETEAYCHAYASLLHHKSRAVRIAGYIMNTLLNAEVILTRPGEPASGPIPTFKLSDDHEMAAIVTQALYVDSEPEVAMCCVDFLSRSNYAGNVLYEFAQRRPLLCNCLNHPVLMSMLSREFTTYDVTQPVDFSFPSYKVLSQTNREFKPNHHVHPQFAVIEIDLDNLPIYERLPPLERKEGDAEVNPEVDDVETRVAKEVYRCEIAMHHDLRKADLTRFAALSSMKRLIAEHQDAFMLFAEPELYIISHEFTHVPIISGAMRTLIFYFLILCRYRLEFVPRKLDANELNFFESDLPKALRKMDTGKIDDAPMILTLREHLLGEERDHDIRELVIPSVIPWATLVSHTHLFGGFTTALELGDMHYADRWLAKLGLSPADIARGDITDAIIVPLLVSGSRNSVSSFYTAAANIGVPTEQIVRIRCRVNKVIASLRKYGAE